MARNVYFVFSNPPPGLDLSDYSDWYEQHAREIVEVPGFAGVRRYWLEPVVGERSPTMYRHLSLYELEADSKTALAELEGRMQAGGLTQRDWYGGIRFASFDAVALEAEDMQLPDHAYLVFSRQPSDIAFDEYSDWYAVHLRENLTVEGFDAGWRFRLEPDTVDPDAPGTATHAALYAVHEQQPALRRALAEAREAGRVSFSSWFDRIEFASVDCLAVSPYVPAPVRS